MKKLLICAILVFPCFAHAGPYYDLSQNSTTGTSTMSLSGYFGVAASSKTPTNYVFRIDGVGGYIQFPDGSKQTTAATAGTNYATSSTTYSGKNTFINSVTVSSFTAKGATDGGNATPGNIGEIIFSSTPFINLNASNVARTVSTITLTAGDWDITGFGVEYNNGAIGPIYQQMLIGTTSNSTAGYIDGYNSCMYFTQIAGNPQTSLIVPNLRVSITTTTTYYLNIIAGYTSGSPQFAGRISARRIR